VIFSLWQKFIKQFSTKNVSGLNARTTTKKKTARIRIAVDNYSYTAALAMHSTAIHCPTCEHSGKLVAKQYPTG